MSDRPCPFDVAPPVDERGCCTFCEEFPDELGRCVCDRTSSLLLRVLILRGAVGVKEQNGGTFLWFDPDKVSPPSAARPAGDGGKQAK